LGTRRAFLSAAIAAPGAWVAVKGFDPDARAWVSAADVPSRPFEKLPKLDGAMLLDDATRQAFSQDVGLNYQEVPAAVLRPGSVEDVVRAVRFANEQGLRVAMRGQGHSQYGQTLVGGGIVIDSSTLRAVSAGAEHVDAQGGASWSAVTEATMARGATPLVMPDVMLLTVGGLASVGGWGHTSHRFGSVADTVEEMDVVTGDGRLVTCSARSERELFEMVLGGLGQVGLIVRARLRLQPAPSTVVRRDLVYDDLAAYVADSSRLAVERRFDHQAAKAFRRDDGGWSVRMNVGAFGTGSQQPDLPALEAGLKPSSRGDAVKSTYAEYLQREAAAAAALRAGSQNERRRSASLTVFVPASVTRDFAARVFGSAAETAALWRVDFAPVVVPRFTRPLFKLPAEEVAFGLWLFRSVPAADTAGHAAALEADRAILDRMRAVGGKAYPPYVRYAAADWQAHFGPDDWRRLGAAKRQLDPKAVLTPGPGMFPRG
jgi:cytokinin dehydrogenase